MVNETTKTVVLKNPGTVPLESVRQPVPQPGGSWRAWQGLLWAEWYAHSKLLLCFVVLWLLLVWTLPLFAHPGWILLLGGVYAIFAGPAYGGGDVLDGSEEFIFSLPPTRAERYCARVFLGAGTLVLLTGINLLALGIDLPQVLAGLYVKTGIIQASHVIRPGWLYGLVFAFPFALFSFSFVLASLTHSRVLILTGWFWALLAALLVLQLCFWYEQLVAEKLTGFFACPVLLACGSAALVMGYRGYREKEIDRTFVPLVLPGFWWLWILVFLLGLGLVLWLAESLARQYPQLLSG
jgi:hypothetical protein